MQNAINETNMKLDSLEANESEDEFDIGKLKIEKSALQSTLQKRR